jgi:hypothetical protein
MIPLVFIAALILVAGAFSRVIK